MSDQKVKVWDPVVRVLHWSLVLSCLIAWQSPTRSDDIHIWSGYACLAVVIARLVWGFVGSPHARFKNFLRGPRAVYDYAASLSQHAAPRHIGHNPLGGWMIVLLLSTTAVICITGYMFTTDTFWGIAWVRYTHEWATHVLVALVCLHIVGNIAMSLYHRENLFSAMWHGRKQM